jgi:hypothetical protein
MWKRLRAVVTLALFLLGLTLVVGFGSGWVDAWLVAVAWVAFAVLSALKMWSMWRSRGNPAQHDAKLTMSQISVLPRSWQRWILDEPRRPPNDHR